MSKRSKRESEFIDPLNLRKNNIDIEKMESYLFYKYLNKLNQIKDMLKDKTLLRTIFSLLKIKQFFF